MTGVRGRRGPEGAKIELRSVRSHLYGMVAIERLEDVINVGPRASGGTEVERRAAFERFTQSRLERAYRLAGLLLRDRTDAEDAVHDAAVQAWLHWGELRDPERVDAWFDRILVNGCRARMRRKTIRPLALTNEVEAPGPDAFAGLPEPRSSIGLSRPSTPTIAWRSSCATSPTCPLPRSRPGRASGRAP
jgi:Sigma-70 region 2